MGGVEYQVTKVDPTDPETKGMVYQVHKVTEEVAATLGGKVYRARIISDPSDPTVVGKVYQIVLIGDPSDPAVKGKVYNAILTGDSEVIVVGPAVSPLELPDAIADSLTYVKAFGGTEQRDIPDNYLQRQFVYMMDGSYLLTDIVPTYDGHYEMDLQTTTLPASSVYFLGGRTVGYGGLFFVRTTNDGFIVDTFGTGSADRYASSVFPADNTRYKFTYDNQVAKVESGGTTLFTNTSTGTNANGAALCINGLNNDGSITAGQSGIYLYSFKAWNAQGELVADYVPAVQKGTVPVVGFYDTVSKTFKTATAGTFVAGGEAVPTPDYPIDIVSNNGVLKVNSQGQIYTDGTVETIEDTIGNTATAEMLLKVGDYKDEQEILSGGVTRNIGVKVLDGTENWGKSGSAALYYRFLISNAPSLWNAKPSAPLLCTHVIGQNGTAINTCFFSSDDFVFQIDRDLTVTDFKQWLADQYAAGTPVIVIYPLATATTESVTGQTLQVQDGDNTLEITQASLNNLELEAEYEKESV